MTITNRNGVSNRAISRGANLKRNVRGWMGKHDNDLVKYSEAIIKETGKSLDRDDPNDHVFKQYKNFLKK